MNNKFNTDKVSLIKKDEHLDDLQLNGLFIIQNKKKYCFSSDSVLLSNFASVGHNDKVLEFCSGSGVISILLNAKYKPKKIIGIELSKYFCDMSNRSVEYNKIENIKFINLNIKNCNKSLKDLLPFDVIVCNPPYYELKDKNIKIKSKYLQSKYETKMKLEDIFKNANQVLKFGGKLYLIHTTERLQEILNSATKYNMTAKNMQFVYPEGKELSHLVLIKFVKGGKKGCQVVGHLKV